MAIDKKSLGKRIRHLRQELDLTQAELAERAGLDTTYLSQVERGKRRLSLEALERLSDALNIRLGALIDDGASAKDDSLTREVRAILDQWTPEKRRAVLKALRALAEL